MYSIHTLKSYAVSNLNRDRFNVPKTCMVGEALRARISSQNVKYTLRHSPYFHRLIIGDGSESNLLSCRTRWLATAIKQAEGAADLFDHLGMTEDEFEQKFGAILTTSELKAYGAKELACMVADIEKWFDETFGTTDALNAFFDWVFEHVVNKIYDVPDKEKKKFTGEDKKRDEIITKLNKRLASYVGLDITLDLALFGRMVADNMDRRVDGAMRVSHFITTHGIELESDFFAAMDDLNTNGSAHLNDADYDTGVFYGYVGIDEKLLLKSLSGYNVSPETVTEIVKAIVMSLVYESSASKQNSMASSPFPSALLVEKIEENIAFTYNNAFEDAIKRTGEGFERPSIIRLKNEVEAMAHTYDTMHVERLWLCPRGVKIDDTVGKNCDTLSELLALL